MARAKKPEEKPKEGATLSIDVDSFVRTRDSVRTNYLLRLHLHPPQVDWNRASQIIDIFIPPRLPSTTTSFTCPPHSNNHSSDQYYNLESRIPSFTRPYPEQISRRNILLGFLHLRASIVYFFDAMVSRPRRPHNDFAPHRGSGSQLPPTAVANMGTGRHRTRDSPRCHPDPLLSLYQAHQRGPR